MRCLLVLLGLSVVACGQQPRAWTYTALLTGDSGSIYVTAGTGGRPDAYEPDGMRHYTGYTILSQATNLGPQSGSARISLGTAHDSGFYWQGDGLPGVTLDAGFIASITIRDTLSGESGTVSVHGTALSPDSWLGLPADQNIPEMPAVWLLREANQDLVLGGNHYYVKLGEVKTDRTFTAEGES